MVSAKTPLVIVVDDDPAVLGSLCFLLEAEGLEVLAFSSGADLLALECLPRSGCLVTNHHLPGLTGLELLERLRARGLPIAAILITSRPDAVVGDRAAALGVSLIVEKPFLDDTLLNGIRRALQSE